MTELVKIPTENYVIPSRDTDIFQAYTNGTLVADMEYGPLWQIVKTAITAAYALSRYAPPSVDEMQILCDTTTEVIKTRYGQLRHSEIPVLFVRGIGGDYGSFKGLSFITFTDWIKAFLKEPSRLYLTTPKEQPTTEPTKSEKFVTAANNALSALKNYSEGNDVSIVAPAAYRFLRHLNLIEYTEKEQEEFMGFAAVEVKADLYQRKALTIDKFKRLEIERTLEDQSSLQDKTVIHSRRLGLYAYFQKCIMDDIDLAGLIEEKRKEFIK